MWGRTTTWGAFSNSRAGWTRPSLHSSALHLSPELAGVHLNLGNIFREQGKLDQALICYREVLRLEPGWHAVRMLLVHLLQHLGLWQDVMELSGHAPDGP